MEFPYKTSKKAFEPDSLIDSFRSFMSKPESYKEKYLQKQMNCAFDGYSFQGQSDSLNQYPEDKLHSFVLSDLEPADRFPNEFQSFLKKDWKSIKKEIRELELKAIESIALPGLKDVYENHIGHMISCNFYPAEKNASSLYNSSPRLTNHSDVSLFTVFAFGNPEGLIFEREDGEFESLGQVDNFVIFPGYLLEWLTDGELKGLNHRVETDTASERWSFASFSLVKPEAPFAWKGVQHQPQTYYDNYLSLF